MRSNHSVAIRHWSAPQDTTMERTRTADRTNLIRTSMLLFAILAIVSFALAMAA